MGLRLFGLGDLALAIGFVLAVGLPQAACRRRFRRWAGLRGRLGCLSMLQDVSRLHAEPSQRVDVRLSDRLDCFIRAKC
jgi:hypothetical protein